MIFLELVKRNNSIVEYGYSVQIVRALLFAILLGGNAAEASASPSDTDNRLREVEAALLHKRLDLSGVVRLNESTGGWAPLDLPPAKVYVVNLGPCTASPASPRCRCSRRSYGAGARTAMFSSCL